MSPGMLGKDESYYLWGFKNELQIIPPTLSIPDVHTSNEQHISTNVISMYIKAVTSRCYDLLNSMIYDLNIAKGTTDPRIEFI